MTFEIWALNVPTGPIAACGTWDHAEKIARALSCDSICRITSTTSPLTAEFCDGRRLPGPASA